MDAQPEAGRTRLAITIALVLAIGLVGAFLLPRLLHEKVRPRAGTSVARVCIEVPEAGLARAGTIRITALYAGRPDVSIEHDFPPGADSASVLRTLDDDLTAAGVPRSLPWDASWGPCLFLEPATAVGGDPGTTGATLSLGLAAPPFETLALEVACRGDDDAPSPPGGKVTVALTVHSPVDPGGGALAAADVFVETAWSDAGSVLAALRESLLGEGWTVEASTRGTLLVRARPGGGRIGSALLSVSYVRPPGSQGAPAADLLWSLAAATD